MRSKRIESLLKEFMALPTITGTADENLALSFYRTFFSSLPYFKENTRQWGTFPCPDDRLHREIAWGLVRGKTTRTVVLIHHMDVVDVDAFGDAQALAYRPDGMKPLFQEGAIPVDDDVRADLQGDTWIFGRGTCDMKGGAAIQLTLLEEWTQKAMEGNIPEGSLLVIGVPDEETGSAGMRAAASLFAELEEQFGLQYILMIDAEPHHRPSPDTRVIHDGSIGKMMPVVLARGKSVHLGDVYAGLNPIHLMSALVRQTELWPAMIEHRGNATTPGATWLGLSDRRKAYNVSLPEFAGGYLNVLTLEHTPQEILTALCREAAIAGAKVLADRKGSYLAYCQETPFVPDEPSPLSVQVLTVEALKTALQEQKVDLATLEAPIAEKVKNGDLDFREGALQLMETYLRHWQSEDPCFLIGLAAPYYPPVNNRDLSTRKTTDALVDHLSRFVEKHFGQSLYVDNYFRGICDLSYAMFTADPATISFVEQNVLFWNQGYSIPLEAIRRYTMPVFNIGPWGKDLHNVTERVNREDLTIKTPALMEEAIEQAWKEL
ncbi:M20/M25/M40 family metallo-hydrolase [Murdochiella sp. Marseille-P8839]|nr:M20/M25/M40 family metallo-hydrolase [Murdochiella sp. Marseille-P8839]